MKFPSTYKLKDSEFYMFSQVLDKDFDNDSNPYLKMKLFIYTNQNGPDETVRVPLIKCENPYLPKSIIDWGYYGQFYCPDWSDEDILWNNYYYKDNSWLRWTIERCQDDDSAVPCATKDEIDDYAHNNIMVLQSRFGYMNLQDQTEVVKFALEDQKLMHNGRKQLTKKDGGNNGKPSFLKLNTSYIQSVSNHIKMC